LVVGLAVLFASNGRVMARPVARLGWTRRGRTAVAQLHGELHRSDVDRVLTMVNTRSATHRHVRPPTIAGLTPIVPTFETVDAAARLSDGRA
jgi:hypothetical protein